MYALAVVSLALAAGHVAATAAPRSLLPHIFATTGSVAGYDPSDIPAECTSDCKGLTDALNCDTSDLSCLCNETVNKGMLTCLECAIRTANTTIPQSLIDEAQSSLAAYEDECKQQTGTALASYTVSADGTVSTSGADTTATKGNGAAVVSVSTMAVGGIIGAGMVFMAL